MPSEEALKTDESKLSYARKFLAGQDSKLHYYKSEVDLLRGSVLYLHISNFVEHYGVLCVLRVLSQVFADKLNLKPHYNELVGGIMSLYSIYSHGIIDTPEERNKG